MLSINKLTYRYNSDTPVMVFPDITCEAGQTMLVMGSSGSGKTTLLHILAGLLPPHTGTVRIQGQDIYELSSAKLDQFRGQHIGIVFQVPHFVKSISALDNLLLSQHLGSKTTDRQKAIALSKRLGVGHRIHARPHHLSQGEQQRLSIARALINSPRLLLADEPTSALDDENCQAVLQLLKEQAAHENAALVIVTHDSRLADMDVQIVRVPKMDVRE